MREIVIKITNSNLIISDCFYNCVNNMIVLCKEINNKERQKRLKNIRDTILEIFNIVKN